MKITHRSEMAPWYHATTYIGGSINGRRAEGQRRADANRSSVRDGQGWVCRDAQVTARDERSSKSQNLIRGESEIERLRDSSSSTKNIQDRLVASFDSQDRTSGGEEDGVGKEVCSSEISGDSDVFHEAGDVGHGRDVGQDTREVKRACIDGRAPERLDTLLRKQIFGSELNR